MGFNLDDYEPVSVRLARWIDDAKTRGLQPRVETALMEYNDSRCVFRATIFEGDVAIATGWAEETRGEGMVNRTSHLENCESSALGRALANAGFAGSDPKKRPSREEMTRVVRTDGGGRVIDMGDRPSAKRPATEAQKTPLRNMMIERGMSTDDENWEELTAADASDRMTSLKGIPRVK